MNLAFDDQLVIDNLEAVTATSVRPNSSNFSFSIANAARYEGLTREAAASFGVVVGADNTWTFRRSEVTQPLKPRDTITDADGNVHRILTAQMSELANFWSVTTRSISLAADLYDLCDIDRPRRNQGQDSAGNREPTFMPALRDVPCRFQEQSRQTVDYLGKRVTEITYDVYFADSLDLTNEDQIRHDGKIYDVIGYADSDRLDAPSRATVVYRGF